MPPSASEPQPKSQYLAQRRKGAKKIEPSFRPLVVSQGRQRKTSLLDPCHALWLPGLGLSLGALARVTMGLRALRRSEFCVSFANIKLSDHTAFNFARFADFSHAIICRRR
jgi:hypothetical protein